MIYDLMDLSIDMPTRIFAELTKLINVGSIQTPLGPDLDISHSVSDANEILAVAAFEDSYDPMWRLSLVRDGPRIVGHAGSEWLAESGKNMGELMDPITPDMLVTADASLLDAIDLFASRERYYFLVLKNSEITGTLFFADLFKLPFRLCLFSLTLELEEAALRLALMHPKKGWNSLPDRRKRKALDIYEIRNKEKGQAVKDFDLISEKLPFSDLLRCTTLADKRIIITRLGLIPGFEKSDLNITFHEAERVRNACAHPNTEEEIRPLLTPRQIQPFIEKCLQLVSTMENQYRNST